MAGWSDRVRIVPGAEGFAYVPGDIIFETGAQDDTDEIVRRFEVILDCRIGPGGGDEEFPPDCELRQLGRGFWKISGYSGDVPGALRSLRGAGLDAQPNHVFFADSATGNPAYGNPAYGNPAYGNPAYGNPNHGHPGNEGESCVAEARLGQGSLVYPNPIRAREFLPEADAQRYESTGRRPNNARPVYPQNATLPHNTPWDEATIRIAVLDTGWPLPPDDLARLFPGRGVAANASHSAVAGENPDGEADGYLDPVAGHGTFIAGLILRHAPGVAVRVEKVLSTQGDGAEDVIAEAIKGLVTGALCEPPHIISCSFGTYAPEKPRLLEDTIQLAIGEGITVVGSAGNDASSRPQYPAFYDGVVSVAALGPNGPASFSNWGDWVRACAPGVDVPSSFWTFDSKVFGGPDEERERYDSWAAWSGTSFAAPIVAAAIAQTMKLRDGITANDAVQQLIDDPRAFRLPCYGTVVNPTSTLPTL